MTHAVAGDTAPDPSMIPAVFRTALRCRLIEQVRPVGRSRFGQLGGCQSSDPCGVEAWPQALCPCRPLQWHRLAGLLSQRNRAGDPGEALS